MGGGPFLDPLAHADVAIDGREGELEKLRWLRRRCRGDQHPFVARRMFFVCASDCWRPLLVRHAGFSSTGLFSEAIGRLMPSLRRGSNYSLPSRYRGTARIIRLYDPDNTPRKEIKGNFRVAIVITKVFMQISHSYSFKAVRTKCTSFKGKPALIAKGTSALTLWLTK